MLSAEVFHALLLDRPTSPNRSDVDPATTGREYTGPVKTKEQIRSRNYCGRLKRVAAAE